MGVAAALAQAPDSPSTRPGGRAPIEERLLDEANSLGEVPFWVMLRDQADLTAARGIRDWEVKGQFVHSSLMAAANRSQPRIRSLVQRRGASQRSFWILNAIQVTGDRGLIEELAAQPEVKEIRANRLYSIPPLVSATPRTNANGVEWNVDRVNAPVVWNSYGARGENVVVCNIDTGVQYDHPALVNSYRGNVAGGAFFHDYNWFDATTTNLHPIPYDNHGHGTHTMGTIVGDGGAGNRIGVAPGARWIAVKGCAGPGCDPVALLRAAQWILAPTKMDGSDPDPSQRPNIVNNSWGSGAAFDTWFQEVVQQWIAAGIFPVFSVGNFGSECWTAASPGDYPEAYSVGAFDISDNLGSFSSGGPTFFGGIKPDISAPGVEVRSAVPNNAYATSSGTSMAAPHVAGVVALLWSAAPALKGDVEATRALLNAAAINMPDLRCGGSQTNNNMWGHGRVDASIAVSLAPRGDIAVLQGGITNELTGEPIAGAEVTVSGPMNATASTDTNGLYSFNPLTAGVYEIKAAAYGFGTQVTNGIAVDVGTMATQDFLLQPTTNAFGVTGLVVDGANVPIPGVVVTILGSTNPPAITDPEGTYSFTNIAEGTYQVHAEPNCCFTGSTQELALLGDTTGFNFSLVQRVDPFGYRCETVTPAYVEATTPIPFGATTLFGNDFYAPVTLPFPFTFYGKSYTNAFVSCNGFLSFVEDSVQAFWNAGTPDLFPPNAGIYCFWDDLIVGSANPVRTRASGAAPNRQFVIEWRDVSIQGYLGTMDLEVVLRENGQIIMQYRQLPAGAEFRGASATIGIENEAGTVALQYSQDRAVIPSADFAIAFTLPPAAFVQGRVTDWNDGQPIRNATMRITQEGQTREFTADDEGFYRTQVLLGTPTIEARANNYEPSLATPALSVEGATYVQDFALATGRVQVNPGGLQFSVAQGQTKTLALTITNTGTRNLNWSLNPFNGYQVSSPPPRTRNPHASPDARTTLGVFAESSIMDWPALTGEVLKVWQPTEVGVPWGVLFRTNVWLTDASLTSTNRPDVFEFTPAGVGTGESRDTVTNGAWVADMAYDSTHGLVCQVNVGGTGEERNCISCWDPATGLVITNISGAWTNTSQRGIAYRPDTDTFYIGSWETGLIYHIKGLSWDEPGKVLSQIDPADGNIAGLAWNATQGVLWEASNGFNDLIYALDPTNGTILLSMQHPDPGYNGAGLECDLAGNLWMVSQNGRKAYLVNSGVTTFTNIPWVSFNVTNGVIAPGEAGTFEVTVHATNFVSGQYAANLFLQTDGGRETLQSVDLLVTAVEGTPLITNIASGMLQNNSNSWLGMQFTVGTNPVSVTALGRMSSLANSQTHVLKLVRASDGQDVAGSEVMVDMAGSQLGTFRYATLPFAVVLDPETAYYLVGAEQEGGDLWRSSAMEVWAEPVVSGILPVSKPLDEGEWLINDLPGHSFGPVSLKYLVPRVLSVVASNDWAEVEALPTPSDLLGRGVGSGSFTRVYDDGTQAGLIAAPISGPLVFREWQKDGGTFSTNNSVTLMMNADQEVASVYSLPLIEGGVFTPASIALTNVSVEITGHTNTTWQTDESGVFAGDLFAGGDFTLSPIKTNDYRPANGVNVTDLVLTRDHILNRVKFTNPLSILAADVDGSASVNVTDLILMRRVILSQDDSFPPGLWRFIPEDYEFPTPNAPWLSPTNTSVTNVTADRRGMRFSGVKLGDVNFSWRPITQTITSTFSRHVAGRGVLFLLPDAIAVPDGELSVPIEVSNFDEIAGLQFTLSWDPEILTFTGITPHGIPATPEDYATEFTQTGRLTFAWTAPNEGVSVEDGKSLFAVNFRIKGGYSKKATSLAFVGDPTPCEVFSRVDRREFEARNGSVRVLGSLPAVTLSLGPAGPVLTFPTELGVRYRVEWSDSLKEGSWQPWCAVTGDGGSLSLTNLSATENRFYRLRLE